MKFFQHLKVTKYMGACINCFLSYYYPCRRKKADLMTLDNKCSPEWDKEKVFQEDVEEDMQMTRHATQPFLITPSYDTKNDLANHFCCTLTII